MSGEMSWAPYEEAIKKIRSVIGTRIKGNESNEISEIHVLANSERNPKQIVRDVESVLAAQFGIEIDHKIVSVVQLEQQEDEASSSLHFPPKRTQIRPKLISISLHTNNMMAEVKVELSMGDETYEGIASGTSTTYNRLRLFVDATVNALSGSLMEKLFFATEDVMITRLGKYQVAQVIICLMTPLGEQNLVGCALVKNDEREAIVKATLDAVNRKLWFY
ncbi:hypothetical protein [Desulfitobacterium chlororespirans]|uniref:Uncharacterized protein n=1 Tax=Desulfitobacterium chlororespirans DSM 11544 TaxID=1121395 RepID=A0A1M7S1G2_9FIRM|nr:hypothetical protein [Desulfitobacterium chlororespirans]SHN52437.1 hypothetical protein SAMN02745215_00404 [Desulfitobacterium chlororespirans DSM 11544]